MHAGRATEADTRYSRSTRCPMREGGAGRGERRLNDAPARIGGVAAASMLDGGWNDADRHLLTK